MPPFIFSLLGPLLGKVIDLTGSKLGVDMTSDDIKTKKLEIEAEAAKLVQQIDLKQLDINLAEASNQNRTWPTWRESLGYICAAAVAYHFVLQQFLAFILASFGILVSLPALDMSGIMTILSAMLGVHFIDSRYNSPMGTMPTVENSKRKGRLVNDPEAGGLIWKEGD